MEWIISKIVRNDRKRPIILTFVFEIFFWNRTEDEVKHSIRSLEGLTQVVNHLLVLLLFLGLTQKEKKVTWIRICTFLLERRTSTFFSCFSLYKKSLLFHICRKKNLGGLLCYSLDLAALNHSPLSSCQIKFGDKFL